LYARVNEANAWKPCGKRWLVGGQLPSRGYARKPETHVFAGHGDLLDFLKTELGKNFNS
jgi:hypothetical protein